MQRRRKLIVERIRKQRKPRAEERQHAFTSRKGCPRSKLTKEQVSSIREEMAKFEDSFESMDTVMFKQARTRLINALAIEYEVAQRTIRQVIKFETWKSHEPITKEPVETPFAYEQIPQAPPIADATATEAWPFSDISQFQNDRACDCSVDEEAVEYLDLDMGFGVI